MKVLLELFRRNPEIDCRTIFSLEVSIHDFHILDFFLWSGYRYGTIYLVVLNHTIRGLKEKS